VVIFLEGNGGGGRGEERGGVSVFVLSSRLLLFSLQKRKLLTATTLAYALSASSCTSACGLRSLPPGVSASMGITSSTAASRARYFRGSAGGGTAGPPRLATAAASASESLLVTACCEPSSRVLAARSISRERTECSGSSASLAACAASRSKRAAASSSAAAEVETFPSVFFVFFMLSKSSGVAPASLAAASNFRSHEKGSAEVQAPRFAATG